MDHVLPVEATATMIALSRDQVCFGHYRLLRQIGLEAKGADWLAIDTTTTGNVWLKFLPALIEADRETAMKLRTDVARASCLNHPNILRILDLAQEDSLAALVMEPVVGFPLSKQRLNHPCKFFNPDELLVWTRQLCAALEYAYSAGQGAHGDVNPSNLFICSTGELKLGYYGIAETLSAFSSRAAYDPCLSGTPGYRSPQQLVGEPAVVSDDVYAVGVMLHEMLTGLPPFHSGCIVAQILGKVPAATSVVRAQTLGSVILAENLTPAPVSAEWDRLIAACLCKDPVERPSSLADLMRRLEPSGPKLGGFKLKPAARPAAQPPLTPAPAVMAAPRETPYTPPPQAYGGDSVSEGFGASRWLKVAGVGLLVCGALAWYFGVKRGRASQDQATVLARAYPVTALTRGDALPQKDLSGTGGLVLCTEPQGAQVVLGKQAPVRSPYTWMAQPAGRYSVRVSLPDYEPWEGEVDIKAQGLAELVVPLQPSKGTVSITGLEGAEVIKANRVIGLVPLVLENVPVGPVHYTVRSEGYESVRLDARVTRNSELRLPVTFEKWFGPIEQRKWTVPSASLAMQWIKPGSIPTKGPFDTPALIESGYWMGITEVTQSQWTAVMGANPSNFKAPNFPVETVSYYEAMEFCEKLTLKERKLGRLRPWQSYTLPTAVQWEYACRAGMGVRSLEALDKMGWYLSNSEGAVHAVGQKQPNAWGLYDMYGNVAEWILSPDSIPPYKLNEKSLEVRVLHSHVSGGAWSSPDIQCNAFESQPLPWVLGARIDTIGFRIMLAP